MYVESSRDEGNLASNSDGQAIHVRAACSGVGPRILDRLVLDRAIGPDETVSPRAGNDKNRLRVRAAMHGRSMEEEARDILRSALSTEPTRPRDLGQAIHERFAAVGGFDLPQIPR